MKVLLSLIVGVMCGIAADTAAGQQIAFEISQIPGRDRYYEFAARPFDPFITLVAPNGQRFGPASGSPQQNAVVFTSFADVARLAFGNWVLERAFPGSPLQQYDFAIAPFTLNEVYHEVPVITSPANGATVPSSFVLEWTYPGATTQPTGRTASANNGAGGTVDFGDFGVTTFNSIGVDVLFSAGVTSSSPTLRAGSNDPLERLLGPLSGRNGAPPLFALSRSFNFRNLSAPITVTAVAVPEPTSLAAISVVLAFAAAFARARRQR